MLMLGDCIDKLKTLPNCSVDAVVTDPPYGLAFMGKKWDYDVPAVEVWAECLRVLKPGGHLLAFAGTRTQHRMAVRIEDAGFEIRDMIAWVYGSGFPKSLDVSKQLDRIAGEERPRVPGGQGGKNAILGHRKSGEAISGEAISGEAKKWNGWGTSLKPALEPITVARKPLIGTVAENVLKHGTGGINVDACRVAGALEGDPMRFAKTNGGEFVAKFDAAPVVRTEGRWPANLIHSGEPEVVGLFPVTGPSAGLKGKAGSVKFTGNANNNGEVYSNSQDVFGGYSDSGSAARFFYVPKASKADRDEGCEGLEAKRRGQEYGLNAGGTSPQQTPHKHEPQRNHHPTVKPTALMRYLCRLVTPPGGIVLDPFMGSGSTGKGAILEGFRFIGIERDPDYMQLAESRIKHAQEQAMEAEKMPHQLELEVASA